MQHPHLRTLLARRWALLALFCGVGLPLLGFAALGEDVWTREGFPWDNALLLAIHARATPGLDRAMVALTNLGGPLPMATLAAALFGALLWRRRHGDAAFFAVAVARAEGLNLLAKLTFRRTRPDLWVGMIRETDYGFPSGHAMGSVALVATLAILLWPTRWRWPFLLVGLPFVVGVGLSRVYLGVHFPSDILAGWCASVAWVAGVQFLRLAPYGRVWAVVRGRREIVVSRES